MSETYEQNVKIVPKNNQSALFYSYFTLALLAGLQTAWAITATVCNCSSTEMRGFLDFNPTRTAC